MNKQRKTSNILNVFQYDDATGIIGLNGAPVSGYGLYLTTNINDGSVGIDSSASINALYLLKNTTKQFEISYDTSGATKIFRLLPYQSASFFQIGNPSNAANSNSDYVFISESTYGNVLIGPGIGNAVSNLTGATASIHKVQFNGAVFANNSIQATSFKITGGASTGFLKADGTVDAVTYLSGNQSITVSGDATGSGTTSIALTLANTAVTPGTYGSTTLVPVVTVDSKGRITSVTTAAISGSLTFTGDVTGSGTTGTSTGLTLAASGVTAGTYTKVTVDSKGRVTVGASATTSDISEGTNLYYTDARVLSYLSANTYATQSYVNTQVSNLVAAAPATLDTLNELAAALGNDPSFATTISTALGNRLRVDINNQGLSATLQGYGRTNLGLGTAATSNTGDFVAYRTFGTAANSAIGDFVAYRTFGTAANNNTGDFATAAQGTKADTAFGWGNHASAGYAASSHTHSIADVTGLQTALDGKQASGSYAASSHSHIISDVTGLQTALDGKQASLGFTPYNATNPSGYITSSSLSSYLPLSGGTVTGPLTISTTEDGKLVLRAPSGDTSQWNYINFVGTDGVRDAYFGTDGSGNPQWWRDDNSLRITLGSTATINDVQIVTNSGTWGINVSGTAGSISGFNNPTTSPTANTIMYRDGSGYVQAVYYYSSNAGRETTGINSLTGKVSAGAGYMYEFTAAAVQTFLGLGSLAYSSATIPTNNNQLTNGAGYITSSSSISGNAGTVTNGLYTNNYSGTLDGRYFFDYGFTTGYPGTEANAMPGNRSAFTYSNGAPLTGCIAHFGAAGYGIQLNGDYQGDSFSMRSRNGDAGTWRPWKRLLTDYNYNSYSPTLTGGGASGTWAINITGSAATATDSTKLPLAGGTLTGPLSVSTSSVGMDWWKDGSGTYMEFYGTTTANRKLRLQGSNGSNYAQWFIDAGNQQIYGDVAGVRNFVMDSTTAYIRHNGADKLWGGSDGTRNSGWAYHNNNDTGLHWPNNGWHFYPKDANDMYMRSGSATNVGIAMSTAGTVRGYVYAENDNTIGFLNNSRGWSFRTYANGNATVYGYLTVNGAGTSSSIYMNDTDEGQREIHCNSNRIGFLTQAGNWGAYCDDAGNFFAANLSGTNTGDQTNISGNAATATYATSAGSAPNGSNINNYYDTTAGNGYGFRFWNGSEAYKISMGASALYYYGPVTDYSIKTQMNDADPGRGFTWGRISTAPIAALNATSGNMQIAGTFTSTAHYITGSTNGGYIYSNDWGIKMANNNGYIQFGPANGSWSHIYSDKSFYFNQELYVNNQQVIHSGNIGSQSVSYAATAGSASANGGNSTTVGGVGIGNIVRKDTSSQYLRAYYEYGSYLTSETPLTLVNEGLAGGGLRVDFMHPSYTGSGGWNHVITWSGYNAYNMYQLGGHYDGGTGTDLWVRSEANHGRTSWTAWRKLLNSSNYNSYSPTLTGGGASGTWGISISGNAATASSASSAGSVTGASTMSGYLTVSANWGTSPYTSALTVIGTYPSITLRGSNSDWEYLMHMDSAGDIQYYFGPGYTANNWTQRYTFGRTGNFEVRTGTITASGDITAYSDIRVKENIEVIENALEKVKAIRGVTFNRTDLENDKDTRHAGVIAQEVLKVLPEVVKTNDKGTYSVAYGNMVGLLIEAIKEQQLQIEELKNKLDNVLSSR